ncbi:MAG: 30S ribosomal protein S18 [Candidatus Margulisiibacteriota bacterium]
MGHNNRRESTTTSRPVKFRRVKKRPCSMCANNVVEVDYKEANSIKRFMTDRAKIAPRRMSGLCPKHQRSLARAVKKSRVIGLVPNVVS